MPATGPAVLMALAKSGLAFTGSAGLIRGLAQSGTTYAVVYGVIGRSVAPDKRSWAMGVAATAGSFGHFLMVPVENWLIGSFGWQNALFLLGCLALAIVPLAVGLGIFAALVNLPVREMPITRAAPHAALR